MASLLEESLARELASWEAAGLRRRIGDDPERGVDFTSNDYLGFARDPAVVEAARAALERFGLGGRASRLLGGGSPLHGSAERACADWLGVEAALLFPTGYQANLGLVTALAGRGDALFSDRLNHASLVDAARLSRARVHVFEHGDADELETQLARARGARRRLVLVEGAFSMDGDRAPLERLHEACARHDAWLVVDEAHAAGLVGPEGAGAWAATGLGNAERLAARVVTGGKALGVGGAFVVGGAALREHLLQRARSFVFTTAPSPALAGALVRAIELARASEDRRERALANARHLAGALGVVQPGAAIVPFVAGSSERAVALAAAVHAAGFDVRAVRPPTVPEGTARLRLACHATNTPAEVDDLARTIERHAGNAPRLASPARPRARRALAVVGTDTGVGKTVVSALLLRAARRLGPAAYWKPVQTGPESDTEEVRRLAEAAAHELLHPAWQLPLPASPHEAAADAGRSIRPAELEDGLAGLLRTMPRSRLVVELAGGLLVPWRLEDEAYLQADWLVQTGVPFVLVARSGLGTLNHTLLTLEALRARHLEPRALFLVGAPHPSNRTTLARLGGVTALLEVPRLEPLAPAGLDAWLDAHDVAAVLEG